MSSILLFCKINFAHSKTNSLLNLACKIYGCFSSQQSKASSPKVCGMLVYKLTASNISCKIRSSLHSFSIKKVFLEILQNSQENTCARVSFLIKLQHQLLFLLEKLAFFNKQLSGFIISLKNTNTDLKISLYVCVHIKTIL